MSEKEKSKDERISELARQFAEEIIHEFNPKDQNQIIREVLNHVFADRSQRFEAAKSEVENLGESLKAFNEILANSTT